MNEDTASPHQGEGICLEILQPDGSPSHPHHMAQVGSYPQALALNQLPPWLMGVGPGEIPTS